MAIQNLSEDVLLVSLPEQPQTGDDLGTISEMLSDKVDHDVVIDFLRVQMLTSESICGLMILDRLLSGNGRRLVLCRVSPEIEGIFSRTGLETVFEFAEDEFSALQHLRCVSNLPI